MLIYDFNFEKAQTIHTGSNTTHKLAIRVHHINIIL